VKAIKHGVRKINIDTDNRMAMTAAIREAFGKSPAEFDPRFYLKPAMKYMEDICKARYQSFGTAGKASSIKQINVDDFAARYKS
jgi:fructose-bisphosphate aldolase class II